MRKNLSRRFLQLVRFLFRAPAIASPSLGEPFVGVPCRPGPLFRSPMLPGIPVSVPYAAPRPDHANVITSPTPPGDCFLAIASCVPGMFAIRVSPQNRAPEPAAARLRSAPRPPGPGIEVMFFLQPAPISRPASGGSRGFLDQPRG